MNTGTAAGRMNFVELYRRLDRTNSTNAKVEALHDFFVSADARESALAVKMILGQLEKKRVKTADLTAAVLEVTKIPEWLFEDAYANVGDLAETLALLVGRGDAPPFDGDVSEWILENGQTPESNLDALREAWDIYEPFSLMVLMKVVTGALRTGVARGLLIKALAKAYSLPEPEIAHALMGRTDFPPTFFEKLRRGEWEGGAEHSSLLPYPFALASPLEDVGEVEALGDPTEWAVEWKWDGIRGQWMYKQGSIAVWSRGEELMTDRFPEIGAEVGNSLLPFESLVLDGEILAWKKGEDQPLAFQHLQTRIGRKKLTEDVLKAAPVRFLAYDCLELNGKDLRQLPLTERRMILDDVIDQLRFVNDSFGLSTEVAIDSWKEAAELRETARERGVEGFILKRKSSPYFAGRKRGDWWKWKIGPMTLDAVLVYAQAGHGKRSNLFTDYTFALYNKFGDLVPVAKAYSGLDNEEIRELDKWVRAHTQERFGPVRKVEVGQIFELGFEGIAPSARHKSGIALRFPRILRWRHDKPLAEIDRVESVRKRYLDPTEPGHHSAGPSQRG
jgi:DNA ligase-1